MITDDEVRGPGMAATTGMNVRERMIGYRGEKKGDGGTATLSCALLRRSCMIIIGSM